MKKYTLTLAIAFSALFFSSCQQQPPVIVQQAPPMVQQPYTQPVQQQYDPQANLGYYNGQQAVQVYDNTGTSFLIDMILYNQLFANGGYNNVVGYYHAHPYASGFHTSYSRSSFRPATGSSATAFRSSFSNSYHTAVVNHTVYSTRTTTTTSPTRSAYGRPASTTTTTATRSSYSSSSTPTPTRSSFSSSPSRSSYSSSSSRSSFGSSSSRSSFGGSHHR